MADHIFGYILKEDGDFLLLEDGGKIIWADYWETSITAKARIKHIDETKTISVKARIKGVGIIKTITTKAKIVFLKTKTVTAKTRIKKVNIIKTTTSKARVRRVLTKTTTAKARIKKLSITKTVTAKAKIRIFGRIQTTTAKARIKGIGKTKSVGAKANIQSMVEATVRMVTSKIEVKWTGYSYYRAITIDHTKVSGSSDLINFPIAIVGTYDGTGGEPDLRVIGSGGDVTNINGYDIIFTSDEAGGTKLDHEVGRYTKETGEVVFWVKIPTLKYDEDTVIYMFYGNSSISTSQENTTGVWNSYAATYHLNDLTTTSVKDSTGHTNGVKLGIGEPVETTGKIYKAQSLDGVNDHISGGITVGSNVANLTVQSWFKVDSVNEGIANIFSSKDNGISERSWYFGLFGDTRMRLSIWNTLGTRYDYTPTCASLSTGWHSATFTWDGSFVRIYLDGEIMSSPLAVTGIVANTTSPFRCGYITVGYDFHGKIEESRAGHVVLSSDWIKTEYNNQNSPSTFYSIGATEESGWIDETQYFISAKANEKMEGDSGEGVASTLDVELDNTTDRFSPNNIDSPIFSYLKPRVPIRISITIGVEYRMFTGYIKNIHPNTRSKICSLECYDNQVLVYNAQTNGIVYEDKRTDELLATLAGLAGLTPTQYGFDVGTHVVNFGYFEERNVWPVMGEIAVAERGRIFFNRYGILTFWNREKFRGQQPVVDLTLDNWITELDYSVAEHQIKNAVIVKATPRTSYPLQAIWSNGDVEYLNPYTDTLVYIPAGTEQDAWLDLEDPCSTFVTPVANTDFTANSAVDGSGIDLTGSISITDFDNYGNAVFLTVRNNSATDAYLTKFQVRGTPVRVINWVKVTATDDTSIVTYGRQELEIENNFIDSEDTALEIAEEELYRRRDSINLFKISIIGIPELECGDVVNVEHRETAYKQFMIDEIEWTLDEKGFTEQLTLVNPYLRPATISAKASIIH